MAKKDNPSLDEPVVQPDPPTSDDAPIVPPDVALAPIAELRARVEELEKRGPKPASKNRLEDIPLTVCNRRHQEVMREVKAERRGIVEQVTRALTNALGGRATNERRFQKDLSGHASELRASVKSDK